MLGRGLRGGSRIGSLSHARRGSASAPAPTLSSAIIPSAGTSISLTFSQAVSIGAGGNGGASVSMSGGASTLTYASGSGSTVLVYSLSRTVESGETGTVSYTQPGNGIEATSGGADVATFSAQSLTNSSTYTSGGTNISWSAVSGATAYKVYYGTTSGVYVQPYGSGINVGNVLTYTPQGLDPGPYYSAITAIDVNGQETGYSNEEIFIV